MRHTDLCEMRDLVEGNQTVTLVQGEVPILGKDVDVCLSKAALDLRIYFDSQPSYIAKDISCNAR